MTLPLLKDVTLERTCTAARHLSTLTHFAERQQSTNDSGMSEHTHTQTHKQTHTHTHTHTHTQDGRHLAPVEQTSPHDDDLATTSAKLSL